MAAIRHDPDVSVEAHDVFIQDPVRECAYYVSCTNLSRFRADSNTWPQIDAGTVTFVIPGADLVHETPPFRQSGDVLPSVLIQDPINNVSYFLSFNDLQEFRVDHPVDPTSFDVSFRIPQSLELIEELPAMQRAELQTNEVDVEARIRRFVSNQS